MAVKLIKLITGEECLAEIPDKVSDSSIIILKNAVKFIMGQDGVGMIPLSPFSRVETIPIDKKHIIFMIDADTEVTNAYNTQFGSGIVTAATTPNMIIQ